MDTHCRAPVAMASEASPEAGKQESDSGPQEALHEWVHIWPPRRMTARALAAPESVMHDVSLRLPRRSGPARCDGRCEEIFTAASRWAPTRCAEVAGVPYALQGGFTMSRSLAIRSTAQRPHASRRPPRRCRLRPRRRGGSATPAMRPARSMSPPANTTSSTPSCRADSTGRSASTACRRAGCSSTSRSSPRTPENGWGYSEQTKAMLNTSYGFVPWDDAHHPQLSPDRRRARRPLAVHQRQQHAAHRPARPDPFETEEILEIPNSRRQPLLAVRHREQRVRGGGHPLQRAGAAARRPDRRLQGRVQRRADLREGGQRHRPHGDRLPDPAARPSTTTSRTRARGRRTAGRSSPATTARRATPSSR